jgi:hypothetical protein
MNQDDHLLQCVKESKLFLMVPSQHLMCFMYRYYVNWSRTGLALLCTAELNRKCLALKELSIYTVNTFPEWQEDAAVPPEDFTILCNACWRWGMRQSLIVVYLTNVATLSFWWGIQQTYFFCVHTWPMRPWTCVILNKVGSFPQVIRFPPELGLQGSGLRPEVLPRLDIANIWNLWCWRFWSWIRIFGSDIRDESLRPQFYELG